MLSKQLNQGGIAFAPRALLLATTALTSVLAIGPAGAQPLPTGGSVAAGSVSIGSPSGTQLNITQTSQSAVVNWQSFSIGQGNSVNILQPNSSSALLNRVTGAAPSTIAGSLTANGQIYLVNPNGIAITKYGVVNTGGGFVASTLGVSDADFMAGRRTFEGNGASAAVSNAGAITVGRGGYAALLGGSVSNAGNIVVPLGKVGLGAGERATLDFSGDGFLQVALPSAAGGTDALIRHSGTIKADGGRVIMSAATAREAARDAVNISGLVQARTIGGRSGAIVIGGGSGGRVTITGHLAANSRKKAGGAVTVAGQAITLKGATIDVSGKTGGGTVNIGGGRQGAGPLQHADTLDVDATTVIRADATATGHGGNVVLWSDLYTTFAGTITARGGAQGGNGGEAEVSGKAKLAYTGITDLSAAHGAFGTLLLDPFNVTISDGTGTVTNTSDSFIATAVDSIINAATLQTALETASVTVTTGGLVGSQAGNITVAAPLTWSTATTLSLTAAGTVTINAPITITGAGGLNITATEQALVTTTGLTFRNGASVIYAGGGNILGQLFTLNSKPYTLVYTMEQLDAIDGKNGVTGDVVATYGTGNTGNYALANDLDATDTTYTGPLIGDLGGMLDGVGHTITGLTINAPSNLAGVGLIGRMGGATVSNIGLVGGSVTGGGNVGALVGSNGATVQSSYATGTVSAISSAGGLVGLNGGTVQSSYATGAVTGGSDVGGLVGKNGSSGYIRRSFATGSVTGTRAGGLVGSGAGLVSASYATGAVSGTTDAGGLIGAVTFDGLVQTSYATGAVSGTTHVGGFIGSNLGLLTDTYWNSETSGQSFGIGSDGRAQFANIKPLTTAQLQSGSLPRGFSSAWGLGAGLYPYLTWQFVSGTTPQSVSGVAYQSDGTALAAATVAGNVDGTAYSGGTTSTGANGYYYFVVPQGTISDSGVFTAITGNTVKANSYRQGATGSVADLNLYADALTVTTDATTLSSVAAGLAGDVGAIGTTDLVFTTPGGVLTPNASTRVSIAASGDFGVDQSLAVSNDVVVTSGGDITVAAPLTWSAAATLGLTAAGAVTINAPITITGAGGLDITATAQAGITTSGLTFGNGASVTYAAGDTDTIEGQSFTLNSTAYTLVYTMEQLDAIDGKNGVDGSNMTAYGAGAAGNYALATDLNATGNTYTKSLFGEGRNFFSGKLDGLGHTITGLTINAPSTTGVGLVAGLSGTVSNIGMVGGSITGSAAVGGLVGNMNSAGATVQTSYATVTVTGTNTLSNTQVGGLVGVSLGIVQSSYATGAVTGKSFIGGLVGYNMGAINGSFATGRVTGTTNTGGLVGYNEELVSASYATGTVTGGDQTGGLLGTNGSGAAVATSYSTGVVSGTTNTGGLIGSNYSDVASSYWNTETSGQSAGFGSDAQSQSANITAKTTAELQNGVLPTGFVSPWKTGAGLYPYLSWQFVDGTTPQSVSGFAYKADGTVLTAATIAGDVDGKGYFGGTTSTGANGYYYFVVPQGTIASDGGVLTAVAGNAVKANSYRQGATGSVANLNLYAGALTVTTNATTLSSVASGLAGDVGAIDSTDLVFTTPGGVLTPNASTRVSIAASGDFGIDQSLVVPNDLLIKAVGSLSFASTGTVSSSDGDATLVAGTTFINDRGADAIAAENGRWLVYSVDPRGDTRSDLVYDFKQYGATYDGATPLPEDESGNGMVYSYAPTVTAELTGVSKTYDGDATATLASGNFSTTGAIDGDAVTFNYGAATYSDKNAATGLTVTATGISIATTTNGTAKVYGYALNSTSVFGSGTINARAVILSGTQTYDGTTTALGENLSVTNLVLDDTVTVSGTGTMAGKDVGAQALTSLTGLTLGNSNYTVAGGSGSVTVTPRAVILSGTQTYNGTTNALGENLSVTNLVLDDTVTVSGTGTMAGKDVGPRALTSLAGLVLGDSNYTLLGGSGSVTVTPANVTVTARSGVSVFRSSPPNPGLSATGLQGGEGIEVLTGLSNSFGITSTSSLAGSPYTLTVEGTLGNPNYNLVGRVDGTWTIIAPATDPSQRASTVVNNTALFTSWLIGVTLFDGFGNGPVTSDGSGATSFIVDRRFSRDWCELNDDGLCTVRH